MASQPLTAFDAMQDDLLMDQNDQDIQINFDEHYDLVFTGIKELRGTKYQFGLQKIEMGLHQCFETKTSVEFNQIFEKAIKEMNQFAIDQLNYNNTTKCLAILTKCDALCQPNYFGFFPGMQILCLNNFGCYYKRLNNSQKALGFLESALKIISQSNCQQYIAVTHLNLSAIYSMLNRHRDSLGHARIAFEEAQKMFNQYLYIKGDQAKQSNEFREAVVTLAITHHNIAIEEEKLQNYDGALLNFQQAVMIAEENLGATNNLTHKFKIDLQYAQRMKKQKFSKTGPSQTQQNLTGSLPRFTMQGKNVIPANIHLNTKKKSEQFNNFSNTQPISRPSSSKLYNNNTNRNLKFAIKGKGNEISPQQFQGTIGPYEEMMIKDLNLSWGSNQGQQEEVLNNQQDFLQKMQQINDANSQRQGKTGFKVNMLKDLHHQVSDQLMLELEAQLEQQKDRCYELEQIIDQREGTIEKLRYTMNKINLDKEAQKKFEKEYNTTMIFQSNQHALAQNQELFKDPLIILFVPYMFTILTYKREDDTYDKIYGHQAAFYDKNSHFLNICFIRLGQTDQYIHSIDCQKLFKLYKRYNDYYYKAIHLIYKYLQVDMHLGENKQLMYHGCLETLEIPIPGLEKGENAIIEFRNKGTNISLLEVGQQAEDIFFSNQIVQVLYDEITSRTDQESQYPILENRDTMTETVQTKTNFQQCPLKHDYNLQTDIEIKQKEQCIQCNMKPPMRDVSFMKKDERKFQENSTQKPILKSSEQQTQYDDHFKKLSEASTNLGLVATRLRQNAIYSPIVSLEIKSGDSLIDKTYVKMMAFMDFDNSKLQLIQFHLKLFMEDKDDKAILQFIIDKGLAQGQDNLKIQYILDVKQIVTQVPEYEAQRSFLHTFFFYLVSNLETSITINSLNGEIKFLKTFSFSQPIATKVYGFEIIEKEKNKALFRFLTPIKLAEAEAPNKQLNGKQRVLIYYDYQNQQILVKTETESDIRELKIPEPKFDQDKIKQWIKQHYFFISKKSLCAISQQAFKALIRRIRKCNIRQKLATFPISVKFENYTVNGLLIFYFGRTHSMFCLLTKGRKRPNKKYYCQESNFKQFKELVQYREYQVLEKLDFSPQSGIFLKGEFNNIIKSVVVPPPEQDQLKSEVEQKQPQAQQLVQTQVTQQSILLTDNKQSQEQDLLKSNATSIFFNFCLQQPNLQTKVFIDGLSKFQRLAVINLMLKHEELKNVNQAYLSFEIVQGTKPCMLELIIDLVPLFQQIKQEYEKVQKFLNLFFYTIYFQQPTQNIFILNTFNQEVILNNYHWICNSQGKTFGIYKKENEKNQIHFKEVHIVQLGKMQAPSTEGIVQIEVFHDDYRQQVIFQAKEHNEIKELVVKQNENGDQSVWLSQYLPLIINGTITIVKKTLATRILQRLKVAMIKRKIHYQYIEFKYNEQLVQGELILFCTKKSIMTCIFTKGMKRPFNKKIYFEQGSFKQVLQQTQNDVKVKLNYNPQKGLYIKKFEDQNTEQNSNLLTSELIMQEGLQSTQKKEVFICYLEGMESQTLEKFQLSASYDLNFQQLKIMSQTQQLSPFMKQIEIDCPNKEESQVILAVQNWLKNHQIIIANNQICVEVIQNTSELKSNTIQ